MPRLTALVLIGIVAAMGQQADGLVSGADRAPAATIRQAPPDRAGEDLGFDADRLDRIDGLVREAIQDGKLPGAVVLVERHGRVAYHRAFGHRAVEPAAEPMSPDTIFDLASLTKVVATATSVMILVEEGRLRLSDRVAAWLPGFERHGKDTITIRHLLTHTSGLRPDVDLVDDWSGYEEALRLAMDEMPVAPPDERFVYSDIGFFLLAEIVARVAGQPFEIFAAQRIFEPLGMHDTMFRPPPAFEPRIAPTEACTPFGWPCGHPGAEMLRGTVHDPTARRMGGVAGHAGLFSTALDLGRFGRMLLSGGELDGHRVLSPLGVARLTSPATPPALPAVRGLGWDIDSSFSANRGDLLPLGSFGHTGFTGTSLWIDPVTDTTVVFLSSRLHPEGRGDVTPLRARVATAVGAALIDLEPSTLSTAPRRSATVRAPEMPAGGGGGIGRTLTGIDVLESEAFSRLDGRRVGLLTNQTGRSRSGMSTIDLLHGAPRVTLSALFSPEHGIRGTLDTRVASSVDEATGLTIHSLYGDTRRPPAAMLRDLDVMVVDLQDVGARFYTYMTTMAYVMEAAARAGVRVMVLDRPNPIGGLLIEGPLLDEEAHGFTGYLSMPIRHGLTLGELARLFNEERAIGAALEVVAMQGWARGDWFDGTGLPWINPSPNLRNLTQATLYPGIGAIEWTNISVGRGTDMPFEQIGAPWIDATRLSADLNGRGLAGIRFYPISFVPSSSRYAGEACHGVSLIVTDREAMRPVRVGLEIAAALTRLHGDHFELEATLPLFGSRDVLTRIRSGEDPAAIAAEWDATEAAWRNRRAPYLLYR